MQQKSTFYDTPFDPVRLLIYVFGGYLLLAVGYKILELANFVEPSTKFPYMVGGAFMFIFAMFGSLFLVKAKNVSKYLGRVIYCYLGLVVATILISWLLTGKSIGEVGTFKWIYLVLTVGFMIFLVIMNFVRKIIEYAEKEEWDEPRPRRRKN